jgi:hypothetical protein
MAPPQATRAPASHQALGAKLETTAVAMCTAPAMMSSTFRPVLLPATQGVNKTMSPLLDTATLACTLSFCMY